MAFHSCSGPISSAAVLVQSCGLWRARARASVPRSAAPPLAAGVNTARSREFATPKRVCWSKQDRIATLSCGEFPEDHLPEPRAVFCASLASCRTCPQQVRRC